MTTNDEILFGVFIVALVFALIGGAFYLDNMKAETQSAFCAVLDKHVPNRSPQMIGGECWLLVGVDDPRTMMSVTEYGRMILEDEK